MAIQIRRGNEADLDIARLAPGELAACLDSGKVIVKLSGGNYLTLTDTPALRAIVEGKADASHTHAPSDITGLAEALAGKQAALTFDDTPTEGSSNPVTSGGVYDELQGKSNTDHTHNTFSGKFVEGTGNDFNNFTKNGIWIIPNIAEVFSSNAPATWENGFLLVFGLGESMIFQLLLGSYTNNIYFRCYKYEAGWQTWKKVSAS